MLPTSFLTGFLFHDLIKGWHEIGPSLMTYSSSLFFLFLAPSKRLQSYNTNILFLLSFSVSFSFLHDWLMIPSKSEVYFSAEHHYKMPPPQIDFIWFTGQSTIMNCYCFTNNIFQYGGFSPRIWTPDLSHPKPVITHSMSCRTRPPFMLLLC